MAEFLASKSSLDEAKRLLAFSRSGYKILDRKRQVLMRELIRRLNGARELTQELEEKRRALFHAIAIANLTTGTDEVYHLVSSVQEDSHFRLLRSSVMGTELPRIVEDEPRMQPSYGMFRSNESLDIAFKAAMEFKRVLVSYLECEAGVRRLSREIRRSGKRADSINKIQIPRCENRVRQIAQALEEKEREDLFRLKKTKHRLRKAEIPVTESNTERESVPAAFRPVPLETQDDSI